VATGRQPLRLAAGVALAVVVVDQLTKQWALSGLDDGPIDLVWTLRLNLNFNSGTAFSLASGRGGLVALLGLVVVAIVSRSALALPGRAPAIAVGAVLGGAVGNLIDRVLRDGEGFLGGRVVDFIDLQWWPVFNIADIAIVLGAFALVFVSGGREPDAAGHS
jgi:signal peptidase II